MSRDFEQRLSAVLEKTVQQFDTPFHIYDEAGIRKTGQLLNQAFSQLKGFREYFAVKALPNPSIMALMKEMGFGFDCSSSPELLLGRKIGSRGKI